MQVTLDLHHNKNCIDESRLNQSFFLMLEEEIGFIVVIPRKLVQIIILLVPCLQCCWFFGSFPNIWLDLLKPPWWIILMGTVCLPSIFVSWPPSKVGREGSTSAARPLSLATPVSINNNCHHPHHSCIQGQDDDQLCCPCTVDFFKYIFRQKKGFSLHTILRHRGIFRILNILLSSQHKIIWWWLSRCCVQAMPIHFRWFTFAIMIYSP